MAALVLLLFSARSAPPEKIVEPHEVPAYELYNAAVAAARRNDVAGAVVLYRRALARKPDLAEAHNNLGTLLQGGGGGGGGAAAAATATKGSNLQHVRRKAVQDFAMKIRKRIHGQDLSTSCRFSAISRRRRRRDRRRHQKSS